MRRTPGTMRIDAFFAGLLLILNFYRRTRLALFLATVHSIYQRENRKRLYATDTPGGGLIVILLLSIIHSARSTFCFLSSKIYFIIYG